ncbi:MAG TPA: protein kinase, partial [Vicinamibacterales bacterium]
TPDEWETVKDMVFACHAMSRDAQPSWLDEHCPPGPVRAEVERLLFGPRADVSFMEQSAPQQVLATPRSVPAHIGRFRIERELGAGGMGIVYAAVDERLGRHVALKVLQPDIVDEERRKRLVWDARAASVLNHPNIVTVYETGDSDGVDYVAMELVAGRTLAEALGSEPWPVSRVLAVATQIAAALEAAHAQRIVHRDLKPSNVILTSSGTAKLVDFGLAKSVGGLDGGAAAPTTIEGRLAGTVAYMSPEQAEGTDVDFRSDIFSFGSLLYEMLMRQRAFAGASTVSILAKIIHTHPPIPAGLSSSIDPRLKDIVDRCLRKDRRRRFQSMGEVRLRLEEIVDEPLSPESGASTRPRRPTWWQYAAVAFAVVASVAIAFMLRFRSPPPPLLTRLTWNGGLTKDPSVSRDGTLLAFASDRAGHGHLDIWLERMGGGDPIQLTKGDSDNSAPDISPNGTHVAYRSERNGGGVYVVQSLGGNDHLIARDCRDPKYSPDGNSLACWSGDVGGAFYPKAARIWIVPATGGPKRQFRPDFDTAAFPLWMPDGNALLFLGRKADASGQSVPDWWVASDNGVEHATGALKRFADQGLVAPSGAFWIRPESWLEGGAAVLFSARREDASNIWSVGLSRLGDLTTAAEPVTLGTTVDERPTSPVAPVGGEGRSLVFASVSVDFQLWRLPLTSRTKNPVAEPLLPNLSLIGSPSASEDGKLLVYTERKPTGYRIVATDTATEEGHSVTTVDSPEFERVIVSGDGKYVVYGGRSHMGSRMSVDQGTTEWICSKCGSPTHINHDGSQALFESPPGGPMQDERLMIWTRGVWRPLVASADPKNRMQFAGRFSPDSRWVAFCAGSRDTGAREIIVIPNAPERRLRDDDWISISEGQTSDREPFWSQDGRRLFFISNRDGFRCIWARDIDPRTGRPIGPAVEVMHFPHAAELLRSPLGLTGSIGLTATADALLFTVARSTGSLWWQRDAR